MIEYNGWYFPDIDRHFQLYVDKFPNTDYQQKTINTACDHVTNFNCVIDIGANVGLHSVRFASIFDKVFSFEPVFKNFECLEKNTSLFHNVTCFKNGLGSVSDVVNIKIPFDADNCGLYSIVDFENFNDATSEEIQIKKLDDYNFSPDLIKIDTQGFEEKVLLGSIKTLELHNPIIIVECENKKQKNIVDKILNNLGYELIQRCKKDYIWSKS